MPVHEGDVAAGAVEAVRFIVRAAVVIDPTAPRGPAVRRAAVVDHLDAIVVGLGHRRAAGDERVLLAARRARDAVGRIGVTPAPGTAERRIDNVAYRISVLVGEPHLAAADIFHDGDGVRQAVDDVAGCWSLFPADAVRAASRLGRNAGATSLQSEGARHAGSGISNHDGATIG